MLPPVNIALTLPVSFNPIFDATEESIIIPEVAAPVSNKKESVSEWLIFTGPTTLAKAMHFSARL